MKKIPVISGLIGATALCQTVQAEENKPNIVVFIADDLGWEEIGAYGNPVVKTPNIDNLAQNGLKFNNFYLCASSSSPSRSNILSGLYPHSTGAMNLNDNMSPDILLFPELLKSAGYYTMLIGKSHGTNNANVKKKFDKTVGPDNDKPWTMGDKWIDALNERPKDKPFFLWGASIDPHRPYKQGTFANPHDPAEVIVPPYLPDIPEMRQELADYYDEISRFDEHIGMVVDKLEKENLLDNTIIMVLTDNGRPFPQSKTRMNVQGLKSPLIIHYPSKISSGKEIDGLASAVDIAPTILDMVDIQVPQVMQGVSMVPLFTDPNVEIRQYAYGEHNWHTYMAFERVIISKDYVFIKNWLPDLPNPAVIESQNQPAYRKMYEMWKNGQLTKQYSDCFIAPRPAEEFFSIKDDIHCINNLADDAGLSSEISKLRSALTLWQRTTTDIFPGRDKLKQDDSQRLTNEIGTQFQLESLFEEGNYSFSALTSEGGGNIRSADGWNVPVITADFNGDGNKDILVSGNLSLGNSYMHSLRNILYLGDGTGKFTYYELPNEGAYYCGAMHYIKTADDVAVIATTGSKNSQSNWQDPYSKTGLKSNLTTMLHRLSFDNDGNPVWTKITELSDGTSGAGIGLHLYDFNNDNQIDILISGWIGLPDSQNEIGEYGPDAQILYFGDGNGGFIRKSHTETGLQPIGSGNSVVADINGDGFLDIVAVSGKSGKSWNNASKAGEGSGVFVSINNGNGTFTTTTLIASKKQDGWFFSSEGARVQVADFNNDGKPDIWIGNNDQATTEPWVYRSSFFLNDGNGNFTEHNKNIAGDVITPAGVERATPVIADFNQDGNLDLWYSCWLPTSDQDDPLKSNNLKQLVGVLQLGDGTGAFEQKIFLGETDFAGNIKTSGYQMRLCALKTPVYAVADFNNDGVPDIVATSGDANNVNFRGVTYVSGAVHPTSEGLKLPEDNKLNSGTKSPEIIKNSFFADYEAGRLTISGVARDKVSIYSTIGHLVKSFVLEQSRQTTPFEQPAGVYIIHSEKRSQKIIVKK